MCVGHVFVLRLAHQKCVEHGYIGFVVAVFIYIEPSTRVICERAYVLRQCVCVCVWYVREWYLVFHINFVFSNFETESSCNSLEIVVENCMESLRINATVVRVGWCMIKSVKLPTKLLQSEKKSKKKAKIQLEKDQTHPQHQRHLSIVPELYWTVCTWNLNFSQSPYNYDCNMNRSAYKTMNVHGLTKLNNSVCVRVWVCACMFLGERYIHISTDTIADTYNNNNNNSSETILQINKSYINMEMPKI